MTAVTWPIYSADDHLDLWAMPEDVWSARVSSTYVASCPHVELLDGTPWWVVGARARRVTSSSTWPESSAAID